MKIFFFFILFLAASCSRRNQSTVPISQSSGLDPVNTRLPQSHPMDLSVVLGLWKTNFGPVKIELDSSLGASGLMGVWVYQKEGREVIGSFFGKAEGNVYSFRWNEPTKTEVSLLGKGYLVFDPQGGSFTGRWWSDTNEISGDWNGWRAERSSIAPQPQSTSYPEEESYREQTVPHDGY